MRSGARSNTALFRTGDEADLPTVEDSARAAPRLSGAQPYARRSRGAAQSPLPRPPPPRVVAAAGKRFGLDAGRRLRRRAQFDRLLQEGSRRSSAGYTFYLARRDAGGPRLGILVSKKHAAAATERNRIKRCIREAFRLEQGRLGAIDVLVRPPYRAEPSGQMIRRLRALFSTLAAP